MKKPKNEENAVTVKVPEIISDPLKYRVLKDEPIQLTRARAFEFLEMETFPGERQVIEGHVQTLFNQWMAGRFIWEHVILSTARHDGKLYRINGQHTCWMRVNIEKDIKPDVRYIEYGVQDDEQLRALYCVFDRARSRTSQHVFRASLMGTVSAAELWPSTLGTIATGFKLWKWEKARYSCIEPSDVITLVEGEYNNLYRMVGVAWQELHDYVPLRKAACIAAMFATFSASAKASVEFWNGVGTGLGLNEKHDARWQLRKYLDTHSQSLRSLGKTVSAEDVYRVCIMAWNKWRKNDKVLTGLRPTDKRIKAV